MDRKAQIDELWHLVFNLLNGPGRYHTGKYGRGSAHLAMDFDENLLNEVAALKIRQGDELMQAITQLRANFEVAETMELFAPSDTERIQVMLDKIASVE